MIHHLTPADLASRWSFNAGSLANMRSHGLGPSYLKIGGRIAYRLEDVELYEADSLVLTRTA
jgi:hypothetical protein